MPLGSFLQIAGALPFSSFLTGGKKRSVKRSRKNRSRRKSKRRKSKGMSRNNWLLQQNDINWKRHLRKSNRKKSNKRTGRRVSKRTGRRVNKRTERRVNKRTKRRVNKRTERRVNKRTGRRVNKRTGRRVVPKGKKCICDDKRSFKGDEPSPKGLGYCAHCTPLRVVMKGQDGNLWENQEYAKGKRWVLIRKDMRGGFIRGGT